MVMRECPSCGGHVPADRVTDAWCWERVPLELKRPFWAARRAAPTVPAVREAGEILEWLRANPPPARRKRAKKVVDNPSTSG